MKGSIYGLGEFLAGLSPEDTLAVGTDIHLYGNAFAETINGKKRRIPLSEWPKIVPLKPVKP